MRELDAQPWDPFLRRLSSLLQSLEAWGSFRTGARAAAVVAVLYRQKGEFYMPFVARRTDLPSHPGQIGLLGGGGSRGRRGDRRAQRRSCSARRRDPALCRGHELFGRAVRGLATAGGS